MNDDILFRYLSGKLPEKEIQEVKKWLSESATHQIILEQLYFTWQVTERLKVMNSVNPEQALKELKKRIECKNKNIRLKCMIVRLQKIAAILFIPLLILSIYFRKEQKDEQLHYIEVRTNSGMISSFELPDGSKVWINANSYLKYPIVFAKHKRMVELQGEGYFEINKKEKQPFSVKVNENYSVEVLGTQFNIMAYEEDNIITTTLVKGAVRLDLIQKNGKVVHQQLRPKEKAIYTKEANILNIQKVNPECDIAWKDGRIIFKNHPMPEVLKILSRHYNVKFDIKDKEILESKITANFTHEHLSQVLEYLKFSSGIKFNIKQPTRIENDTLKISVIELRK